MIDYAGILIAAGSIFTIITSYLIKKRNTELSQFHSVVKRLENHINNLEERINILEEKNNQLNEKYQKELMNRSTLETENRILKKENEYFKNQILAILTKWKGEREDMKIALDAGHSEKDTPGKQTPDGIKEWTFNNKVLLETTKHLKHNGFEILRTDDPTGKKDIPLKTRTDKANNWRADLFISIHHNALRGKWGTHTGTETHIFHTKPKESFRLATLIQAELVKAYGLRDRGLKFTNLHINREAKMTSCLVEGGFMDSTIDIKKLKDDNVLKAAGKGIAMAICKYYNRQFKDVDQTPKKETQTNDGKLYRLQLGAYQSKENCQKEQKRILDQFGLKTYISYY